jgi:coproporphyrinogen III oxidase-like Fe-S oxidoreductase
MAQWAKQLREQGLPFEVSLIYGLPHQTLDSFRASIAFAQVQQT